MEKRKLLCFFLLALSTFVFSCKKDAEVNKDTFKIEKENVEASTQSVRITGTYAYSGTIDGITLELGRQADLMDGDAYRTLIEDSDFSVEVKNLRTNTKYYYRYAVEYGGDTPYRTDIKSFSTLEYNLPEVKSNEVVSVGVNRAEVKGEVLGDGGGDAVTLRGICWGTSHNPSVGNEYANAGEGIGAFTCELTNLLPEKTYYARAFAGNSKGVAYGEELTFVTLAAGSLADVHTLGITGNAMLQATVNGEVTNEGTSAVLERGVCYGKEHYPTTSGLHVASGSGAGEYSCQLTNLEANTTYYVRAYAINSLGTAYGEEMSFVAQTETTIPVVQTDMVSDITVSSATGHGIVISDGGASVTRRGLCWSTNHNPTINGTHAECGSGVGEFSGLMSHLTDLTTYYVRAYAENAIGIAYGEEVSFTVGHHLQQYTIVVSASPTVGGSVTGNGTYQQGESCTVTAIANADYTFVNWTENSIVISNNASYTFVVIGDCNLVANFTLQTSSPTVTTSPVTNVTPTTATGGGNVTSDGNSPVTGRGICWSTSHNPTTNDSHASSGTGTGSFTVEMTGLTANTIYYVRAYAQNSAGTAYGDEESFSTEELASGDEFSVDFEAGMPVGWTVIDANNDGYTWCLTSAIPTTWEYYASLTIDWYHNGTNAICSGSYINGVGAITPDEYLVSPLVTIANGSQLSFWVAAVDTSYPADHFGVFVSDNGTSNWTSVQEWTLTAKKSSVAGGRASRDGEGLRLGTWYNYTVDLSAYTGQKYVAFRHFNCNDQYIMCLDDVELSNTKK